MPRKRNLIRPDQVPRKYFADYESGRMRHDKCTIRGQELQSQFRMEIEPGLQARGLSDKAIKNAEQNYVNKQLQEEGHKLCLAVPTIASLISLRSSMGRRKL